ncbi:pentatricopeptide repeat-containing protein [Rosa sericea]
MKPSRWSPLFNFYSRLPGVSLYSTTAKSPPSTSHRTHWKGTLNRLYGRISKIADPKAPIHPILDQWIQQGRPVDKVGLVFMIKELKHFKRFDNALQSVRLDLIAKVHGVEQAESYFDNIPIQLKSLGVYLALLNCYAHAKLVEKAEATMQKIRDLGLARTSLAYNNLLNLYYQTGKRDKLDALVNEMEEKRIQCNKFTYGILLSAYAAASDFEAVEKILAQWESHPDCRLDWINYAVVANVYIKAGNEDKALAMLKKSEELIPSSERRREAYEHLVPQYAALGKKDNVVRLWELYKGQMKVYNKGYRIMITSLLKIGDSESAEKIFEEWESQQSVYDVRIPNHLIAAYARKGLLDKAEAIIERVILKGAKPDAKSWYSLAKVHLDHDQTEKAVELTRKALLAVQPGWKTNKDVWAACLNYLIKKPDPEGAKEYIKLLTDKNVITVITQERLLNKINKADSNSVTAGEMEGDGLNGDEEASEVSEVEVRSGGES